MMIWSAYFGVVFIFVSSIRLSIGNADVNDAGGTVIFSNILFRHGDRTPIQPYPNDPYGNESLWPVPFAQLTNIGKQEHLMLGRWFRTRYNHLLTDSYSLYDIYIQSSDIDRTIMSAEANLAGLYPPKGDQVWNELKWMPIPVHTIPLKEDNILYGKKYCPRYNYELANVLNSFKYTKLIKEHERLFDYLTKMSGDMINSLEQLEYLYNTLYIESLYNLTLPKWTKLVYPDQMKVLADLSFTIPANNKILQRLKIGSLIGEMVDHMVKKSTGALVPDRKIWMYSAHDETIANFLMALNLFEPHCPPYASSVLVELRKNTNGQHFVTVSYKNSSGEPTLFTLPGCLSACPLKQFVKLTHDLIPEDWTRECLIGVQQYGMDMHASNGTTLLIASVVFILLTILMIVCFILWHLKRQEDQYYLRLVED